MGESPNQMDSKNPNDNFYELWLSVKSHLTQPSKLKAVLYNLTLVIVIAIVSGVCLALGIFIKPLVWAVLIGAVLFPFKYSLASSLKSWFSRLEKDDTHLLVGIALVPLETLDNFGAYLWSKFLRHLRIIIGGAVGLFILSLFIAYAPKSVWSHTLCSNLFGSLHYSIVIIAYGAYIICVTFYWKQENSFYFSLIGQTLWLGMIFYVCSFLGAFQIPALLIALSYIIIGFVYYIKYKDHEKIESSENDVITDPPTILEKCASFWKSNELKAEQQTNSGSSHNISTSSEVDKNISNIDIGDARQSDVYFKALFLACLVTIFYKQLFMIFLAFIPIGIYLCNNLILKFGIKEFAADRVDEVIFVIQNWIVPRHAAVLPLYLPGVIVLNGKVHRYIRSTIKDSIDTASSIIMILLLILIAIFASVFCAVEIYSETITVVQLGKDVINHTLSHKPELVDIFPKGTQYSLDTFMEDAYQYSRKGIETYIDEFLKDANNDQRTKLKEQMLNIWDRMIHYWMDSQKNTTVSTNQPTVLTDSIEELVQNAELFSVAQHGVISLIRTNIGTLLEVIDSVWLIVKQNLNILTSITGTLSSIIMGGGSAVVEFLLNSLIFFSALFYLLSNSDKKYYPLVITKYLGFSSGQRIAEAVEASISSVLIANAKLALFHGLFMWLTHTIFGARVVFLPAVFAGITAALPFLDTYWCSLPAFLDLWLIQDRFILGVILVMIHFLFPSNFVDPAIYADVSDGGHEYLTGLSIAGGMYFLGVEGAIFGPIVLCFCVAIFNLTKELSVSSNNRNEDELNNSTKGKKNK